MVVLARRLLVSLLVAACASLIIAAPLSATGQDVINDYMSGPNGGGTIESCYSPKEFQQALVIARRDKAQYSGAVETIQDKQAECRNQPAASTVPAKESGGGSAMLWVVGGLLLVAAVAAAAVVGRKRQHDDQFADDDSDDE